MSEKNVFKIKRLELLTSVWEIPGGHYSIIGQTKRTLCIDLVVFEYCRKT